MIVKQAVNIETILIEYSCVLLIPDKEKANNE